MKSSCSCGGYEKKSVVLEFGEDQIAYSAAMAALYEISQKISGLEVYAQKFDAADGEVFGLHVLATDETKLREVVRSLPEYILGMSIRDKLTGSEILSSYESIPPAIDARELLKPLDDFVLLQAAENFSKEITESVS
jgi:hypothetical protein